MFMKHVPGGCHLDVEENEFSRHRLKKIEKKKFHSNKFFIKEAFPA
jgi:hypothetical protein